MRHYIIIFAFILLGGQGLFAQDNIWSPYDIGTYSSPFSFVDSENTNYFTDDNGGGTADVYYRVTVNVAMNLTISTCGSELTATDITVLDESGNLLTDSWDQGGYGACSDFEQASISLSYLQPGTYYFIVEGTRSNGYITTSINGLVSGDPEIGDMMDNPIDIGTQSNSFTYNDTQNTTSFSDNYGQSSNDIYYRFTLSQATTVILSHCGSNLNDTYIHLLDASGTLITENDDWGEIGASCSNTLQSYIKQDLPAGTYYVVSEGYGSGNGSITTNIQGIVSSSSGGGSILTGSSGQNYIFTITPTVASPTATNLTTDKSLQTIQYFDGLGRPVQTVQGCITPTEADLVSGIEYDGFGRDYRHWLPGAAAGNGGAYVSDFGAKASSTNLDAAPYSTTKYEESPLNRVKEQYGAGTAWYDNTKRQIIDYTTNESNVKYYYVEGAQLKCNSAYATSTLYGQKTTDEDGKTLEEFTDKQGRKVLSRVAGDHDTYYVYDDLDNLRYVLPPMAADALGTNTSGFDESATSTLGLYGYIYHYDGRKRCTQKKLPGCDWIYMVYDHADRLILSQDGNQRLKPTKQWTVTKYDALGRALYIGLINSDDSRATMESNYSGSVTNESYTGSGPVAGYTSANLSPITLLTVNYYDNYSFISNTTLNYDSSQEPNGYTPQYTNAKGLLAGTRVYHLNDPNASETTALYYDKYGRVVQTRGTNHLGGYDLTYTALDFTGKPTKTLKNHNIAGQASVVELYTYDYDKAQRLTTTKYSLNGGSLVTLAVNTYDDLGRLKTKTLGGVDATTYSYNVRSWTTGINGSHFSENLYYNANTVGLPSFTPAYNGNIAGMQWGAANESGNRAYSFTYDGLNRLTDASYTGFSGGVINGTQNRYDEHFGFDKMGNTTTFTRNGLLSSSGGYGTIDNLSFTYNGNQKVKITDSGTNGIFYGDEEFIQNGTNTGNSCAYDTNGNRLYDSNSNIWGIRYNMLNLPDAMQFYQGHQTNYTYSAAGAKLKVIDKTAPAGVVLPVTSLNTILSNPSVSTITTTDYVGNMIYENGTLKRILTSVGYWQAGTFYYFLKDHLGSNRVVMTGSGGIAETSSYYPSGMRFGESAVNGGSVQPYRHTGHEMQEMHGLNWVDNLARFRTVSDGSGFTGIDPLAEKYYSISPYVYCHNNPVNMIDPDGLTDYNVNKDGYISKKDPTIDAIKKFFGIADKNDKLIAVDNKSNTLVMPAGTIGEIKDYKDAKGNVVGNYFNISNDKVAGKVDNFLSENTGVEWSRTEVTDSKSKDNIISTSHNGITESVGPLIADKLLDQGLNVTQITHSHLTGEGPSGFNSWDKNDMHSDRRTVDYMNSNHPDNTIRYRVYDVRHRRNIYYNNAAIYK